MKKRITALSLALAVVMTCMLCFPTVARAYGKTREFDSLILEHYGYTADEWFSTASTRALFTVCMQIDVYTYCEENNRKSFDTLNMLQETSIVGRYDNFICVYMDDGEYAVFADYNTVTNVIRYTLFDGCVSEREILKIMSSNCIDGVYVNSQDDIVDAAVKILRDSREEEAGKEAAEEETSGYAGVYTGKFDIFTLTLTLDADGTYVFEQYEPYTGGITEYGQYKIEGNEIFYYASNGRTLKYIGYIDGALATVGELEMTREQMY